MAGHGQVIACFCPRSCVLNSYVPVIPVSVFRRASNFWLFSAGAKLQLLSCWPCHAHRSRLVSRRARQLRTCSLFSSCCSLSPVLVSLMLVHILSSPFSQHAGRDYERYVDQHLDMFRPNVAQLSSLLCPNAGQDLEAYLEGITQANWWRRSL